ncbi:hypothetical protein [Mycobacterium sp. SMC-4]|uniref:hypothetical protein n=1 Tax=Mycobacterium sp. SMC-4 TaxID=2857059 RepID=UPI003CFF59ED
MTDHAGKLQDFARIAVANRFCALVIHAMIGPGRAACGRDIDTESKIGLISVTIGGGFRPPADPSGSNEAGYGPHREAGGRQ